MCKSETSCGCATVAVDSSPVASDTTESVNTTYTVIGLTCGGCAQAVTTHVASVKGVTGVQVDLTSGTVAVSSDAPLDTADVRAAVEQAGYQLAS